MLVVSVHVETEARRQLLAMVRRDPARMARRWEPLSDATIRAFDNWDRTGALQASLDNAAADDPDLTVS